MRGGKREGVKRQSDTANQEGREGGRRESCGREERKWRSGER